MDRLLFRDQANIQKRTYLWHTLSSIFFGIQSALFLLVLTRTCGEMKAGAFIILFTVAQTLTSLGNYNIRDFQVSDLREDYAFRDYYSTRILTCLLMLLAAVVYGFWKHLDAADFTILLSLILYRFIECFEDVYHGDMQRAGRLDVAALCMALRIILSSAAFSLVCILTRNPVLASLFLVSISLIIFLVLIRFVRKRFPHLKPALNFSKTRNLLTVCFPVFAGAFLYAYLVNAPKYAIDDLLSKESQTAYSILFMPVFVINMLNMFLYKPLLVKLSELWKSGDIPGLTRQILRQVVIILSLTLLIMAGGYWIGLSLLSMIYGVDLAEYRLLFVFLLLSGGFTAIAVYLNTLLTIFRKQVLTLVGYCIALVIHLFATRPLVRSMGISGAGIAYGIIMSFLMLFWLITDLCLIRSRKKQSNAAK